MPPFTETPSARHNVETGAKTPVSERSQRDGARGRHRQSQAKQQARESKDEPGQPAANPAIPQYDLAEHILAEHRQATSRKRRAPVEPVAEIDENGSEIDEPVRVRTHIPMAGASEQESRDLQTIVAEIVARDIARLSRGVAPAAYE